VRVWDVKSGELQQALKIQGASGLAFSPAGNSLISGGNDDTAQLWDVKTGLSLATLEGFGEGVLDMAVSPDGSILTTHRKGFFARTGETSNGVRIWDAKTGQLIRTIGPTTPAFRLALSADGQILATIEHEGFYNTGENPVRIWDVASGQLLQTIRGHSLDFALALSPDGQLVAISNRLYVARTGELLYELKSPTAGGPLRKTVFSPDGTKLAAGRNDGRVAFLWETKTGKLLHQLEAPVRYFETGIAFSPDGKIVAVGYDEDNTIRLWQVETGRALRTLAADGVSIRSLAFSPDGTILASSARTSTTIQLWNWQTGQLLRTVDSSKVEMIHFALDGRLLVTLRLRDGLVQLWGVPPE
jgi:WD40 repeat protein